jgi:tRNA(fMet)-specific endonuclease VapC
MFDYMLDTNICIYILAGRAPQLSERFEERASTICVSTVVLAELWYGVENSQRREANALVLSEFAERVGVLDFSPLAAQRYGAIRADLRRLGRQVGFHDMMIAAHARSEGLTLVTNNRLEFDRMPGLLVENWVV